MSAGARATRRSTACPATTSVPVTPAGRKRRILRRQRRGQRRGHRQHHSASRRGLHCAPPCTRTQDSAVSSHESHITLTGYGSEQAITSSPVGAPKNPPPLAPMTTYCLPSRPTYVEGVPATEPAACRVTAPCQCGPPRHLRRRADLCTTSDVRRAATGCGEAVGPQPAGLRSSEGVAAAAAGRRRGRALYRGAAHSRPGIAWRPASSAILLKRNDAESAFSKRSATPRFK